ncbi:MAG TPA: hypothetical protein VKR61_09565 [Bryobacteraceae bacterium]|nr:hypothetical protein [Bryobacteraceae bacterium]
MRKAVWAVMLTAVLLGMSSMALAATFPACDSFGQDWSITLGPFGGSFPGTYLVSGCRDCNNSLGCGGFLPLDGAVVVHAGIRIYSVTAYSPVGSSCFSTHWTGAQSGSTVSGNVSNNGGPFGTFSLALRTACQVPRSAVDPATHKQ